MTHLSDTVVEIRFSVMVNGTASTHNLDNTASFSGLIVRACESRRVLRMKCLVV